MAKRLYPGGIEVAEGIYGYSESIAETDKVISERLPLYEPAFEFNSGFARVDILNPVGEDSWEIIEVKSGTRVKDQNLVDTGNVKELKIKEIQSISTNILRSKEEKQKHENDLVSVKTADGDMDILLAIKDLNESKSDLINVISLSLKNDISIPCFNDALNYFNSISNNSLSTNMIQAQRNFFGSHSIKFK